MKFKDWVRRVLSELRTNLWLGEYKMHISFDHYFDNPDVMAEITTDTVYLQFHVRLSTKMRDWWKEGKYRALFEVLAHEMSHPLTQPLYEFAKDHLSQELQPIYKDIWERQTERASNIVTLLAPESVWLPSKMKVKK